MGSSCLKDLPLPVQRPTGDPRITQTLPGKIIPSLTCCFGFGGMVWGVGGLGGPKVESTRMIKMKQHILVGVLLLPTQDGLEFYLTLTPPSPDAC
eukprot:754297-Hanusia_phi.AAC.1